LKKENKNNIIINNNNGNLKEENKNNDKWFSIFTKDEIELNNSNDAVNNKI